jgi:enoyl-CoA hydratase/carnithine racemase
MDNDPPLLVSQPAPGVRQLTLHRPASLNAVTLEMARLLAAQLDDAAHDPAVRVLVLTGTGPRAFSAGYDIHEMAPMDTATMTLATLDRSVVIRSLARHPKPVIAALNGVTYGAGALYALAADLRIAGTGTRWRITAAQHGAAEGTWQLPQLVGPARAKEILMTAREVRADEGLAIGLYQAVVPDDQVLDHAVAMATAIAAMPPAGPQGVKQLIDAGAGQALDERFHAEQMALAVTTRQPGGAATFEAFLARGR